MRLRGLTALLLAAALAAAGCAIGNQQSRPQVVVGSGTDSESMLLAGIYVTALRTYGFEARAETGSDPMAKLDSGTFTVVPAFTGQVLQSLQPGVAVTADSQVYKVMMSVLPEGIVAGDYTTAAEDKPALVVTPATAVAWESKEPTALARRTETA